MTPINEPGIYALAEADYHADPCAVPSLSSSIARTLIERSPRHAWTEHPRLNPAHIAGESTEFDLGRAAHAVMLEGADSRIEVIQADDFRTAAARAARDAARAAGRLPLLPKHYEAVKAMVIAARLQLANHRDAKDAFIDGKPEMTLVWNEGEAWCRARLDWVPNKGRKFPDYKSTATSAHPDAWGRMLFNMGYDVQAAFYRRGIRAVLGIENPEFIFVVQENQPPYALSVIGLSPHAIDLADRKVEAALDLWRWCLKNDSWPGYPNVTCYPDVPVWHEQTWAAREGRDEMTRADGADALYRSMIEWQRPLTKKEETTP